MMLRCQVESLSVFSTHFYCVSQSDWKFSVHKTRRCVKIHVYTEVITNKLNESLQVFFSVSKKTRRHVKIRLQINSVKADIIQCTMHISYIRLPIYTANTHSRWMNLVSWCLTHWPVGESGQPHNVWRQSQHTDVNTVKARLSKRLDLPDLYIQQSSSLQSKSLT